MRQTSDMGVRKRKMQGQLFALVSFLFIVCMFEASPAEAQTSTVNGSYSQNPINQSVAGQRCADFDKRFPFSKARRAADQLQLISGATYDSNSTTRMQSSAPNSTPCVAAAPALMLVVPNQSNGFYSQPLVPEIQTPPQKKDTEIFQNLMTTTGLPLSDTQFQMIDRENRQRRQELKNDPEVKMWSDTAQKQLQAGSAANSIGGSANEAVNNAFTGVTNGPANAGGEGGAGGSSAMGALINIANENAAIPTTSDNPWKPIAGAVWMVQQMYKFVFIPMAILFLLPGAVLTQVKGQITSGILGQQSPSPFEGILRAMIAVFLIPATQLIMSYAIDVGNSLTYSVNSFVDTSVISTWTSQTIYVVPNQNVDNAIKPPPGSSSSSSSSSSASGGGGLGGLITLGLGDILSMLGLENIGGALDALTGGAGGDGLAVATPDTQTIMERQLVGSQTLEVVLNAAIYLFSMAVLILGAYQLVFMCYLFLLGPLAAALFAWPVLSGASASAPNSNVFSGWVDAVITVSLWRFFWMVILAIMTQRILWMMDTGQQLNLQWEVTMFICFLGLMLYVPFHPWDYDPGRAFTQAMAAGQQLAQAAGPAAAGAAKAAGMSSSQINQIGGAFNNASQNISGVLNNQDVAAAAGAHASGAIANLGTPPNSGGNGASSNSGNVTPSYPAMNSSTPDTHSTASTVSPTPPLSATGAQLVQPTGRASDQETKTASAASNNLIAMNTPAAEPGSNITPPPAAVQPAAEPSANGAPALEPTTAAQPATQPASQPVMMASADPSPSSGQQQQSGSPAPKSPNDQSDTGIG